ncbi:MAG: heavy metal translocating P-type ATPase metal-binding domain-containing protein, partial [Dokdonella sp.]
MTIGAGACWHCGELLPATNIPQAVVAGVAHSVCCHGCRAAAEWIGHLGLAAYYRVRTAPAVKPAPTDAGTASDQIAWQRPQLARHVVRDLGKGRSETVLLVDGIRCSACVWLLERALTMVAGVVSVQINAGARRARIIWNANECNLGDIVAAFARTGYRALPLDAQALDDSRRDESRAALKRMIVAGFGAMQAMMYASALYLGAFAASDASTRELMRWLGLLVATPVVFYSARPFFAGAMRSLRARTLGMDVPVALAIALIYLASLVQAIRGGAEVYFDSVSMFVFFLLIGRYLEMRARHRSADLSDALARMTPVFADRLRDDGSIERVGAIELVAGDLVQVAQGMRVPADGVLVVGTCRVDEALLSGESTPLLKRTGDALIAGSMLVEGPARLQVEKVGSDTVLAGIVSLVARAQSEKPNLARTGDLAARHFVSRILALAALTLIGWSVVDPARASAATLAVLVVSCPCAFALAVPAALTRALAVLARCGILVVRPDAIEGLANANHIIFDKTGTLTDAEHGQVRVVTLRAGEPDPLALASALAGTSAHPLARAIARAGCDLVHLDVGISQTHVGAGI